MQAHHKPRRSALPLLWRDSMGKAWSLDNYIYGYSYIDRFGYHADYSKVLRYENRPPSSISQRIQMKLLLLFIIVCSALSGCVTKQYPIAPKVSVEESTVFDCQAVKQEISKTYSVQDEIAKTGRINGITVLDFMEDFGIGNGMSRHSAESHANERLAQLVTLKTEKCRDDRFAGKEEFNEELLPAVSTAIAEIPKK
jgi:hypothetical protein